MSKPYRSIKTIALILSLSFQWSITSQATEKSTAEDLTTLNLEDLMNVEVTSVSKQKQKASDAPAAVTVITQDDIHRSHFDSVPELLRLVPGVDVARLNANTWAISARGFNDVFANKLLVLVDGRTVYTPLFAGVSWDAQETMVADLDRIEVIRGPGATLWGANAVNGVINVTSKNARDTQGGLFDGRYGSYEQEGNLRYGGKIDANTYYRVWSQYKTTHDFPTPGGSSFDGWDSLAGGFRLDRYSGNDDTFTMIGNLSSSRTPNDRYTPSLLPPYVAEIRGVHNNSGGNLLGRWTHVISEHSDFSIQAYFDRIDQTTTSGNRYTLNLADIEFQHRFPLGQQQEVIWGIGYRFSADEVGITERTTFDPIRRDDYTASAFVQDDITVVKNRLHAIVGTKIEQNSYSGFEVQPSLRLLWTPSERQSLWASVSRAVRTPNRFEENATLKLQVLPGPGGVPILAKAQSDPSFDSEDVLAYEIGHRFQATRSLSFDTTAFYNKYSHLRSFQPGTPSFDPTGIPHVNVPVDVSNKFHAESYGVEIASTWKVTDRWRLSGSYSLFIIKAAGTEGNLDISGASSIEGTSPRNQAQFHSYYDLTRNLQLDASLYYVDSVSFLKVQPYFRADLAMTWKPKDNVELTVGVQNLLEPRHAESSSITSDVRPTDVPRTVYAQLVYRF